MQREEPATRLVDTLVDEISGECLVIVNELTVLERIMHLGVRHRARVEPHVDEVALTLHRFAAIADQQDVVDIRTVHVNLVVVLLRHIARNEAFVFQRVALHNTGSNSLLDFTVELFEASDALLLAVLTAPDGQRCTPEARTREVPVVQVVEPITKTACTRRLGMPANGGIQLAHALLASRALDKPRVERIVEHWLIGTPAVGIVVDVLLDFEHLVLGLQVHADRDIECLVLISQRLVVGVLHITSCKLVPLVDIHVVLDKLGVEVVDDEVLTLQVDHRALGTLLIDEHDGTDACLLGYKGVVSTEIGGDVDDTGTVIGSDIVARNHLEGIAHGLDGGHQLLVLHTHEVGTLITGHDAIGNQLFATRIFGHIATIGNGTLCGQIGIQTSLGEHQCYLVGSIRIIGLHSDIVDFGTYAECRISSQRPRCRRPGKEIRCTPLCHLGLRILHLELCGTGGVLHVTIATRLVQLVRRQARTGSRAIGLNGVALIKQALVVELLQQVPQGLDVFVVVGDVRIVKVYEVSHAFSQFTPLGSEHHDVLTTLLVVVFGRNILVALLIVDISLGNAQLLLNAQLDGQSMGVPACLALHLEALHGLIAVESILQRTAQHVVNTRVSVSRGRALIEYKLRTAFTLFHRAPKDILLLPHLQHVVVRLRQVQAVVFGKSLAHKISVKFLLSLNGLQGRRKPNAKKHVLC